MAGQARYEELKTLDTGVYIKALQIQLQPSQKVNCKAGRQSLLYRTSRTQQLLMQKKHNKLLMQSIKIITTKKRWVSKCN